MERALRIDNTLNRKGKSFAGYPSGTTPTLEALSFNQLAKIWSESESFAGPDGCVPILTTQF